MYGYGVSRLSMKKRQLILLLIPFWTIIQYSNPVCGAGGLGWIHHSLLLSSSILQNRRRLWKFGGANKEDVMSEVTYGNFFNNPKPWEEEGFVSVIYSKTWGVDCPLEPSVPTALNSSSFGSSNLLNAAENWIDAEIYEWHAKRNTSWNINHLLCHVAAVVLDQFICKLVCRPSLIQHYNRLKFIMKEHHLNTNNTFQLALWNLSLNREVIVINHVVQIQDCIHCHILGGIPARSCSCIIIPQSSFWRFSLFKPNGFRKSS